jgi:hypothetical protein
MLGTRLSACTVHDRIDGVTTYSLLRMACGLPFGANAGEAGLMCWLGLPPGHSVWVLFPFKGAQTHAAFTVVASFVVWLDNGVVQLRTPWFCTWPL